MSSSVLEVITAFVVPVIYIHIFFVLGNRIIEHPEEYDYWFKPDGSIKRTGTDHTQDSEAKQSSVKYEHI